MTSVSLSVATIVQFSSIPPVSIQFGLSTLHFVFVEFLFNHYSEVSFHFKTSLLRAELLNKRASVHFIPCESTVRRSPKTQTLQICTQRLQSSRSHAAKLRATLLMQLPSSDVYKYVLKLLMYPDQAAEENIPQLMGVFCSQGREVEKKKNWCVGVSYRIDRIRSQEMSDSFVSPLRAILEIADTFVAQNFTELESDSTSGIIPGLFLEWSFIALSVNSRV